MVGLSDLTGLFQPKQLYDSTPLIRPSPQYLKSHGSQVKTLVNKNREKMYLFLENIARRILGTTNLSAYSVCLE